LGRLYVVQENFSSLDGAQGDVATIVNSLRSGKLTSNRPPNPKTQPLVLRHCPVF
jgi:hypothetical protein